MNHHDLHDIQIRKMNPAEDVDAIVRLFRHAGWVSGSTKDLFEKGSQHKKIVSGFCEEAEGYVAVHDKRIESYAQSHQGTIRQTDVTLPLCAVTGVICSYILRKQRATSRLLAHLLVQRACAGDAIAMLGVFDQGYYDRLGFGTNPYEYEFYIDPRTLQVDGPVRPPQEFSVKDVERIYHSRRKAHRIHGTCTVDSMAMLRGEMIFHDEKNGFILGYTNDEGEITHHVFGTLEGEHGPAYIPWMVYQTPEQLVELLCLIKGLSDQFYNFLIVQPPQIQLQDFLREPFRSVALSEGGKFAVKTEAYGFSQLRILDLEKTIGATHLSGETVSFNIQIDDPIRGLIPEEAAWRGLSGTYTVHLGEESSISSGTDNRYETVHMSINDFSRMIHGSVSPLKLKFMQKLDGSESLTQKLTRVLHLPEPHPFWLF